MPSSRPSEARPQVSAQAAAHARAQAAAPPAKTRCFLVGTARGGTTLLQSMLGAHPAVYTLPETHFWDYSVPKQPWLRRFRSVMPGDPGAARDRVERFLTEHGLLAGVAGEAGAGGQAEPLPEAAAPAKAAAVAAAVQRLPDKPLADPTAWTRGLFSVLDALAAEAGRSVWLEKTPLHLYYTDLFRAADPAVRIVHMLRDPVDQVASLVDAGTRHGEAFRQGSVSTAWKRWKKEYILQRALIGRPGHAFVCYEDLVAKPEETLRPVLSFLGLPWDEAVMAYQDRASGVIASGESWKNRNTGSLSKSNKAERVLDVTDREWLRRQAAKFPLAPFREAKPVPYGPQRAKVPKSN